MIGLSQTVSAWPVPSHTLRTQVIEADLIIVARVDSAEPLEQEGPPAMRVRLTVIETLKGVAPEAEIAVMVWTKISTGSGWPRWEVGRQVLAFLNRRDLDWWPVGAELAARDLGEEGTRSPWVRRTRELLPMLEVEDTVEQDRVIVEWMVETAEDPLTRWDGAFDLAMGGRVGTHGDDELAEAIAAEMSAIQVDRLVDAAIDGLTRQDRGSIAALDFASRLRSFTLASRLKDELRLGLDRPDRRFHMLLMFCLARLYRWDAGRQAAIEFCRLHGDDAMRSRIAEFLVALETTPWPYDSAWSVEIRTEFGPPLE